ncbi:MAG: GatB/YqeY domain-containing protein, partial [Myxococcota bacterium]
MALGPKIMAELKAAMKAKDTVARDTLRMLKSQLGEAELAKGGDLEEADELAVLMRAVKTRTESAAQYAEGGRQDLADKERAEITVIQRFLPKALTEDEARA